MACLVEYVYRKTLSATPLAESKVAEAVKVSASVSISVLHSSDT